jgi:cytochrome c oxidase subunit 1
LTNRKVLIKKSFKLIRIFYPASHKDIGRLYFYFGIFSGLIGTSASWLLRIELGKPRKIIRNGQVYNVVLTGHAILIIFFLVIPILIGGFGNWLLPLLLGVGDMIFPRLNLFSWWLLPGALLLFLFSAITDRGRGTGWTFYPPLSSWGHRGSRVD